MLIRIDDWARRSVGYPLALGAVGLTWIAGRMLRLAAWLMDIPLEDA